MNSTSSSLISESCCPLVPLFVTLLANCSISSCLLTLMSCDGGDTTADVGVGVVVVKLVIVNFGNISGADVVTVSVGGNCAVGTAAVGGTAAGFTLPPWEVLGIVSSNGLPDTGTTVWAPATPSAISCNA